MWSPPFSPRCRKPMGENANRPAQRKWEAHSIERMLWMTAFPHVLYCALVQTENNNNKGFEFYRNIPCWTAISYCLPAVADMATNWAVTRVSVAPVFALCRYNTQLAQINKQDYTVWRCSVPQVANLRRTDCIVDCLQFVCVCVRARARARARVCVWGGGGGRESVCMCTCSGVTFDFFCFLFLFGWWDLSPPTYISILKVEGGGGGVR